MALRAGGVLCSGGVAWHVVTDILVVALMYPSVTSRETPRGQNSTSALREYAAEPSPPGDGEAVKVGFAYLDAGNVSENAD